MSAQDIVMLLWSLTLAITMILLAVNESFKCGVTKGRMLAMMEDMEQQKKNTVASIEQYLQDLRES